MSRESNWMSLIAAVMCATSCGPKGSASESMPTFYDDVANETPSAKVDENPWANRTDLIATPPPGKPVPVALPKVERFTLANGLAVLVIEDPKLPLVEFGLTVRVGEGDEVREKRSIASFAAAMLTKGARGMSADKIAQMIDSVGGTLGTSADFETTSVGCAVLSKDIATCLKLLPKLVISPTFLEKEIGQVRDQLVTSRKQLRDDASQLMIEHFENALWGDDHVRGWPVTLDSIAAIQRNDLRAWHRMHFRPNNAVLAVAGDVNAAQLKQQLRASFGRWKRGKVPEHTNYGTRDLKGLTVRLVDKPDQTQSQIIVGHYGLAHADADFLPTLLMNYTLGGGAFSSRLMKVIRSKGGKTYGARSSLEAARRMGAFRATTFTRNAETVATLKLVLGEMQRMHADGPTVAELADAVSNIAGKYPLGFQSASDMAGALVAAGEHGLSDDYVRDFPLRIAATTRAAAAAAAKQHLDPENAVVVIVGRAKDVAPQLQAAGIAFETVGHMEPISSRARREKLAAKTAPIDAKKTAAGKRLLEAALRAKGGIQRLKALKTVTYTGGEVTIKKQGRLFKGGLKRQFLVPDKLRMEAMIPLVGGAIVWVITKDAVWQEMGSQARVYPAALAAEARRALWRERDLILLRHREKGVVVQSLGKVTVGGTTFDGVMIRKADGTNETNILLDANTRLIRRLEFEENGVTAFEEFDDYRARKGIQFPFKYHNEASGVTIDAVSEEVEVNTPLGAELFAKPATK